MPSNAEIAKDTIEQFKKIQDYMVLAKEEKLSSSFSSSRRKSIPPARWKILIRLKSPCNPDPQLPFSEHHRQLLHSV